MSGTLTLTLFWEDCQDVTEWCVKCCDLREAAQGGRCAALGGIKSSDETNSSNSHRVPNNRFSIYSEGDNWRWKPIFSSFVDKTSNNGYNNGHTTQVDDDYENIKYTSFIGTCAEVISYERRNGTVRLQIHLGSVAGGDPVDDDSCFAFLISGFRPTTTDTASTDTSNSLDHVEGEWSLPTRSLSLACDPTAQIPKRRAADIPKSNAVRQDASIAALIAASGRLATRAALAVATGIATGG